MYIVYFSSATGAEDCEYAMGLHEINNMLRNRKFEEIDREEFFSIDYGNPILMSDKNANKISIHRLWSRGVFMAIFRAEPDEQGLSNDDRAEVFGEIMLGTSDFMAERLQRIFNNYDVRACGVVDYTLPPDEFAQQIEEIQQNYVQNYDYLQRELQ